jgi:hypothetical protein
MAAPKGSAKHDGGQATKPAGKNLEPKDKGAPRPRKWDYGITPEAKILCQKETPNVKREVQADWEIAQKSKTYADYAKAGGSRHGIRVMSRRGLIKLVHADGKEYPVQLSGKEKTDVKSAA